MNGLLLDSISVASSVVSAHACHTMRFNIVYIEGGKYAYQLAVAHPLDLKQKKQGMPIEMLWFSPFLACSKIGRYGW